MDQNKEYKSVIAEADELLLNGYVSPNNLISIIIVDNNNHSKTIDFIHLVHDKLPENQYKSIQYYELIIVDNASETPLPSPFPLTNQGVTRFRDLGGFMTVIRNDSRISNYEIYLQVLKITKGNIVIFIDSDVSMGELLFMFNKETKGERSNKI